MNSSIRWRMVIMFVLLVIIVLIASGTLIVYQTREYENNLIEEDLKEVSNGIRLSISTDKPVTEIEADIKKILVENRGDLKNKKVFLLDNQGTIIYTQSLATKETAFYDAHIMAAIHGEESDEVFDAELIDDETRYIAHASSIKKDNQVVYVLYLLASSQQVQEKVFNMTLVIMLSVFLAIVLSVVLAFLFSSFLTRPISALSQKAKEMTDGKWREPIAVTSTDEIGGLTQNFNKMATSLNDTMSEIASEKNKMETVITHMTDGILVFDNYGIIIHKNPAAIRMLKLGLVSGFKDVFDPLTDIDFSELLSEIEFSTKKATIRLNEAYYSVDFAKYIDKDGTILGVICVIQDITEHKKIENMQKEFVANVSHELRTPLTTIKSYAETLLEGSVDDLETTSQFLGVINNESDRMTALVQDLLELSKIDNKKANLETEVIDLAKLVFRGVENYRIHADKKNQELTMKGFDGEFLVLGDVNRIEQVFKNILSNSVKYSEEGESIQVILSSNPRYHIISIADTGMGMPEEDLPRIFDRFYRVDKARSRAMGGTGLGLAIAKEIVELHNGKIRVESELNVGTTFKLYFPIYQDTEDGLGV